MEETIPAKSPEQIAILRLGTDWRESTEHELTHLFPRLAKGGVLIVDDYGWWRGSRLAVDEHMKRHGVPLLLSRIDSGGARLAIKP